MTRAAAEAEAVERRARGERPKDIAATLECSTTIVKTAIRKARRHGAVFPTLVSDESVRLRDERDAEILRLYKEGAAYSDIAEAVGANSGAVANVVAAAIHARKVERRTRRA